MKFTKFGKALLMSALSAGSSSALRLAFRVIRSVFVCDGHRDGPDSGSGIITGFKIDHNTGKLTPINGLPVSSGGTNPVRAVLHQRQPLPLCTQPRRQRLWQLGLHHGEPMPEFQYHAVRGWRQRHPHPAGDLLHAGHQSHPNPRRRFRPTTCTSWTTIPPTIRSATLLSAPASKPAGTSRPSRSIRQPDACSSIVNAQVTSGQRLGSDLLPSPGQSHRLCAVGFLLSHPQRHTRDRRFGLPIRYGATGS